MAETKAAAPPITAAERAASKEARRADNRAKHRGKRGGAEAPEFAAAQTQSLDAVLQTLGGGDQGISVVVLQVAPQRHGELGGPSHILEQPYSPTLREADLKDLARQSGSADPGTFELRIQKTTEKGPKTMHVFRRQWRWKPDPAPAPALDPLGQMEQFAKTALALKGLSGMGAIDAALVNALKPQPVAVPPSNPVMDRLMEAVVARLATPADPLTTLVTATDFLERVKGPPPAPTDPIKMLAGLGEMLTTVKALVGGLGAAEAPASSPWIEVLRLAAGALGPLLANVPAMWQMASAQRAAELEAKKREVLGALVRANVPLATAAVIAGVTLPPPAFGTASPGRAEHAGAEAESGGTEGPSAGPLGPFYRAIIEGDTSVFPGVAAAVMSLPNGVGQKILDGLAGDPNALELIRGQIDANGGRAFFAELFLPGSDAFFAAFAEWLRSQGAPE